MPVGMWASVPQMALASQCVAPWGFADVIVEWRAKAVRVDKAGGEGLYTCPFRGRLCEAFCGAAAALAQLDRASVYGTEGCRFESCKLRFFPLSHRRS